MLFGFRNELWANGCALQLFFSMFDHGIRFVQIFLPANTRARAIYWLAVKAYFYAHPQNMKICDKTQTNPLR